MDYIAHIRNDDQVRQSVKEHLLSVANLSATYANSVGGYALGYLGGVLHDSGKLTEEFRSYILEAVANPDSPPKRGKVDHSTAGAKLLFEQFHQEESEEDVKLVIEVVGNAILSHHGNLQDYVTDDLESDYLRRVQDKILPNYDTAKENFLNDILSLDQLQGLVEKAKKEIYSLILKNHPDESSRDPQITITLLLKYLFSCLIDADRTDTRRFEENDTQPLNVRSGLFADYYDRLLKYMERLKSQNSSSASQINQMRSEMSLACDQFADNPSGVYTLSIPTGGGKTFSSLRYALKHAKVHKKDRIIYILPYTSIIEQNAEEVRKVLEDRKHILEHHSNIIDGDYDSGYTKSKMLSLAEDNWDAPIIFTTMVQYLNAFYSSGTKNIRRMHNLSNSILIFDEVQAVPLKCLTLFNETINFLKNVCHSSVLLCTATQPALDHVEAGIDRIDGEMIDNLASTAESFKRVEVFNKLNIQGWGTEELSDFVKKQLDVSMNVLVILNTKKAVRDLYKNLEENSDICVRHLSTSMCAAHRKNILKEVKSLLKSGMKVVCISTQLIEAGVDISFECVIRSLAGLDSIAQAAGRCNRHGEKSLGYVYVINHKEESLIHLPSIKKGGEIAGRILKDIKEERIEGDILSPDVMNLYFRSLYKEVKQELDYPVPSLMTNLHRLIGGGEHWANEYEDQHGHNFPLKSRTSPGTVGKHFNVIDQNATTVLVPYKDGKELIADFNELKDIKDIRKAFKQAQNFSIQVFDHQFQLLTQGGDIIPLLDGKVYVLRDSAYDQSYGLTVEESGRMEGYFY